jgi:hypothetical protein
VLKFGVITAIMATLLLTLPWTALAEYCFQDSGGSKYSLEIGSVNGSRVEVFGYRKTTGACLSEVGGIEPLVGTAVIINANTVTVGWQVYAIDLARTCTSFRENYTLNLTTLVMTGSFQSDSGNEGSDTLTLTTCPTPADEPSPGVDRPGTDRRH